jgi:hypothetical protein
MSLRDLRDDLRHRLRGIELEIAQLQGRIEFLRETQQHLEFSLKYEDMRMRQEEHNMTLPFLNAVEDSPESSSLARFLRNKLSDGRNWSLEELKRAAGAESIAFDGKQPGRVLHFALLGMAQNKSVEMVERGVWRIARGAFEQSREA